MLSGWVCWVVIETRLIGENIRKSKVMKIIKRLLIIFIGSIIFTASQADQAQRVSQKEVNSAIQLLKTGNIYVIKKLCKPCGEQLPQNIVIDNMAVQDANYKGLWELVINGQAIDLAYYYVPIQGRWVNFARAVDIYVDDMPKYLESLSVQAKIDESKGWYINPKQKMVITQDVNTGTIIALLGRGQFKKLSILFHSNEKKNCEDQSIKKSQLIPMYVNDTLVKFTLLCNENFVVYYAETEAGNTFVLDQFIEKNSVTLKAYSGGNNFVFSSKGFNKLYKKAIGIDD